MSLLIAEDDKVDVMAVEAVVGAVGSLDDIVDRANEAKLDEFIEEDVGVEDVDRNRNMLPKILELVAVDVSATVEGIDEAIDEVIDVSESSRFISSCRLMYEELFVDIDRNFDEFVI